MEICVKILDMLSCEVLSSRTFYLRRSFGNKVYETICIIFSRTDLLLIFLTGHFLPDPCASQLGLDDQIFGDPDAADIVFTSGADVLAVGINVTHQVVLTGTRRQICGTHS